MTKTIGREIPVFFAADNDSCPFLAVALQSMLENASEEDTYTVKILHTDITGENKRKIAGCERKNADVEFVDLSRYIKKLGDGRDCFSGAAWFKLFIPGLFPQYDRALYLDSDIVVLDDIAALYDTDMGDNLLAAVPDEVTWFHKVFQDYAEKVVGVADYRRYFDAGVLLMNLHQLRRFRLQEKFLFLSDRVRFSVAKEQDYLNRLCKGRVKLEDRVWNRMPIPDPQIKVEDVKLIHYNLEYKPWHFEDILYKEFFWMYAQETEYFDAIQEIRESYTDRQRAEDEEAHLRLRKLAKREADCVGDDRKCRR